MKLILLQPHTDAGKEYDTGDSIEVDEGTAAKLIKQGIAEPDGEDD